jgi:alkanesulfonate monooxygenase SsuD/methylene tetrahydromethanopterin reductase-like flavin-dependent oxidoreductase (luciferase family)
MKVGVMLPVGDMDAPEEGSSTTWSHVRAVAEAAEGCGLDSVWIADHLLAKMPDGDVHGMHDAWTLLSAVAAVTSRVELGPLVLCSSFRDPGVIAKMASTLDEVSAGRLVLGLGAGWHDPEYEAFGFPTSHRVSRFAEALEIIVRLLRRERVSFEGRYYQLSDAVLLPSAGPLHPGARRRAEAPDVAIDRHLGGCVEHGVVRGAERQVPGSEVEEFERALQDAGRPSDDVRRTLGILVGGDPADAIARKLHTWAELGVDDVIAEVEPITPESVERLGSGVRVFRGA